MLCLLQIHAHPDDEASKGSGVAARYAAEGVRTVLVTCTGGEAGEILNPAADTPEARADLKAVRLQELEASTAILGYNATHLLGYRDSGMPESTFNAHPEAFANAPEDEALAALVTIVRAERPQVIITYPDDQSRYPHPDHLRVHDLGVAVFDAAGDPDRFAGAGPAWQPLKLYYSGSTVRAWRVWHGWFSEQGRPSPFGDRIDAIPESWDERFGTRIDIGAHLGAKRAALLAHATQITPDWFWLPVPDDIVRARYPYEEYILARSLVEVTRDDDGSETDLFSGIRETADGAVTPHDQHDLGTPMPPTSST